LLILWEWTWAGSAFCLQARTFRNNRGALRLSPRGERDAPRRFPDLDGALAAARVLA